MAWNWTRSRLIQIGLASAAILSLCGVNSLPAEAHKGQVAAQVDLQEILSYQCARSVASMMNRPDQIGPVFVEDSLIFTSVEARDSSRVLIVSAGSGTYAIPLARAGINRIRFELPVLGSVRPISFFLSYMHDARIRSRYYEFSVSKPPSGHDELDYVFVQVSRAQYMLPNLDYAVLETSENALTAIKDGKLQRHQFIPRRSENCENVGLKNPAIARNIRRNLDMLDMMVSGPLPVHASSQSSSGARMPASLGQATPVDLRAFKRSK